jgi:hypothetical protein
MDTTSPNQCCPHCDKKYTRKSSYTRHVILCEVLHQTKREKKCAEEETTDIPTTRQLYNIIQELAIKYRTILYKNVTEYKFNKNATSNYMQSFWMQHSFM